MDDKIQPETIPQDTAGQAFVKTIRPAGMALFLLLAVLVTAICLTSGRDPIPGYAPPETADYYAAHPEELISELETHVFPALPDYDMTARLADGGVTVAIDSDHFVVGRAALLRYFDESLLTFERS